MYCEVSDLCRDKMPGKNTTKDETGEAETFSRSDGLKVGGDK